MTDLRTTRLSVTALILVASLLLVFAWGCGSEDAAAPGGQQEQEAPAGAASAEQATGDAGGAAPILRPDSVFTIDDVATAGFKKSKQYPTDTLPQASDVWYGFYNQKDVEVRIYPTHADAVEFGIGPADNATGREWRKGGGEKGAGTKAMSTFGAYIIAGNLVILCELDVTHCEALVAQMD